MVRAILFFSTWLVVAQPASSSTYVIGVPSFNACPGDSVQVRDVSECQDAAASVGGTYHSADVWEDYPGGCYVDPVTSKVWMNNHPGEARSGYSEVCRKLAAGEVAISLRSDGLDRNAILHIPKGATGQIPLVVDSHAWNSFPVGEALLTGFSAVADREGFAVVYPRGYDLGQPIEVFQVPLPGGFGYSFNAGGCCPKSSTRRRDDVQFIRDLVAHIVDLIPKATEDAMQIDQTRVYATGMSNGGFFTNRLACQARDLFAAVAPVSGVLLNGSSPQFGGDPFVCPLHDPPLPVLHFHGHQDLAVPWNGNPLFGFPSVPSYLATRLRLNGLPGDEEGVVSYSQGAVTCTAHGPASSNVTLCKVLGGGHSWPGSKSLCGPLVPPPFQCSNDIDATEQIWSFFKRYSLKSTAVEV